MRAFVLVASLALAVTVAGTGCKRTQSNPGQPVPTERGFVQEVDGRQFAVIQRGDTALVIALDDHTPMMLASGVSAGKIGGQVTPATLRDLGRFAICPCCALRCNNCNPGVVGVGCHPGLALDRFPKLDRPPEP